MYTRHSPEKKEEPRRNGKALLQLTTYETQSSIYWHQVLSPSPGTGGADTVTMQPVLSSFKIFILFPEFLFPGQKRPSV